MFRLAKPITKPIELILSASAFSVLGLLFFKAIFDVDRSYDTWAYHLPFASRLWGITTPETFTFNDRIETLYDSFPLLGELLQGFFWLIFDHVPAANLVGFAGLILFLIFLKKFFRTPLYLSAIALLTVPLIQIHVTSAYVDLPGNLALTALILMVYLLYTRESFLSRKNLILMLAIAGLSANTKLQLMPIVFVVLCFAAIRIILILRGKKKHGSSSATFPQALLIGALLLPLVFFTPLKNLFLHGNPVYPIKIEIAGFVLNHTEEPYSSSPNYLNDALPSKRWVYSILEVGIRGYTWRGRWSMGQWMPRDSAGYRMGGFFNLYVVLHLSVFAYLLIRIRSREARTAAIMFVLLSLLASVMPQSHELRYYMFWMMSLVSLNLYLITLLPAPAGIFDLLNHRTFGAVCLLGLAGVLGLTGFEHVRPKFYSVDALVEEGANEDITRRIAEDSKVCIVSDVQTAPRTFLFASIFHEPKRYSVKAAKTVAECGSVMVLENYQQR